MKRRNHTNATHWTGRGLRIEHSGRPVTVIRDLFISLSSLDEQQEALELLQQVLQRRRARHAPQSLDTTGLAVAVPATTK